MSDDVTAFSTKVRHAIRMELWDYMDADEEGCPACGWFEAHKPDCLLQTVKEAVLAREQKGLREAFLAACKAIEPIDVEARERAKEIHPQWAEGINVGRMDMKEACDDAIRRAAKEQFGVELEEK